MMYSYVPRISFSQRLKDEQLVQDDVQPSQERLIMPVLWWEGGTGGSIDKPKERLHEINRGLLVQFYRS